MRKNLLFIALTAIIFSSCSKNYEDRLTGSWQLDRSWKQGFLNRDYFTTGYESGVFTFSENGDATYTSSTDTLTGYWRSDRYTDNYYNSSSDQWESKSMKYLKISLVNFAQNRRIEWEFDDFNFRNNWREFRAEQYSWGNDRIYEFRRR